MGQYEFLGVTVDIRVLLWTCVCLSAKYKGTGKVLPLSQQNGCFSFFFLWRSCGFFGFLMVSLRFRVVFLWCF